MSLYLDKCKSVPYKQSTAKEAGQSKVFMEEQGLEKYKAQVSQPAEEKKE